MKILAKEGQIVIFGTIKNKKIENENKIILSIDCENNKKLTDIICTNKGRKNADLVKTAINDEYICIIALEHEKNLYAKCIELIYPSDFKKIYDEKGIHF